MPNCKQCTTPFQVTDTDRRFYHKVSPTFNGERYEIPEPTLCPDCRLQRRMVWRNERNLYCRKCDATGQLLISWIAPEKVQKIYRKDIWWSENWNALDYGKEFNSSRPFFEQMDGLIQAVPWIDLLVDNAQNSGCANFCNNITDCNLIYASHSDERCYYCSALWDSVDCMDCFQGFKCELCYGSVDINDCQSCLYCKKCDNCTECILCENCDNCKNCFGSVNLSGKEYYFMNEQLTEAEYTKRVEELNLGSYTKTNEMADLFAKHRLEFPMQSLHIVNSENSTGDAIRNCKNSQECFDSSDIQDSKWVFLARGPMQDCYDLSGGDKVNSIYEVVVCDEPASKCFFSSYVWGDVSNLFYCVLCPGSKDCFGCVGLKKKQYCILNKQYTKDEYEKLVPQIIEHMRVNDEWGEFFPVELSPFDYNETIAQNYFPLTKDATKDRGWSWRKKEEHDYQISHYEIPDAIEDVTNDITEQIFTCKDCGKSYRITFQELKFYRQYKIPVPHVCSDCRLDVLMRSRNPRKLWARRCASCNNEISTTYSPNSLEKVYCASCYSGSVDGDPVASAAPATPAPVAPVTPETPAAPPTETPVASDESDAPVPAPATPAPATPAPTPPVPPTPTPPVPTAPATPETPVAPPTETPVASDESDAPVPAPATPAPATPAPATPAPAAAPATPETLATSDESDVPTPAPATPAPADPIAQDDPTIGAISEASGDDDPTIGAISEASGDDDPTIGAISEASGDDDPTIGAISEASGDDDPTIKAIK